MLPKAGAVQGSCLLFRGLWIGGLFGLCLRGGVARPQRR